MRKATSTLAVILTALVLLVLAACETGVDPLDSTDTTPAPPIPVIIPDVVEEPEVTPVDLCGGEECNQGEVCWNQQCCTPAEDQFGQKLFLDIPGTWSIPGFTNEVVKKAYQNKPGYKFAIFPGNLATVPLDSIEPDGSFYYEDNSLRKPIYVIGKFTYQGAGLIVTYQVFFADGTKFGDKGTQTRIR